MSNAYIFYGKAGSGKGTQAQLLKTHLESQGRSVVYIETGGLFRNFVETNTGFSAQRTKTVIESGQLMPAFFPIYLWSQAMIEHFNGTQDLILDGVTRRIEEAPILESALDFFQIEKKIIFNIHINDTVAQARLLMRADDRPDDADPVKIQKRLDWYNEKVLPVLEYFKQNNTMTMCDIDGEPDVAQVQSQVLEFLDKI